MNFEVRKFEVRLTSLIQNKHKNLKQVLIAFCDIRPETECVYSQRKRKIKEEINKEKEKTR